MHPKEIKKQLAREITAKFHSEEAALAAERNFEEVFQKKGVPDEIPEKVIVSKEPVWLPQLLVDAELVKSSSEGRRMIKQNAVSEMVWQVNRMSKDLLLSTPREKVSVDCLLFFFLPTFLADT